MPGLDSRQGLEISPFSSASRLALPLPNSYTKGTAGLFLQG
jgi:hypothetical protein